MIEYLIYALCVAIGYGLNELVHRRKAKSAATIAAAGGPGEE